LLGYRMQIYKLFILAICISDLSLYDDNDIIILISLNVDNAGMKF
jgi:hypothetical protein